MTFGVNDYPFGTSGTDPYGFAAGECASFANFRCVHDFGIGSQYSPNGLNGAQWAAWLGLKGYPVDSSPRVHDVISLAPGVDGAGQFGHVAIVLDVLNNGDVWVEDYNWFDSKQYLQHVISGGNLQCAHVATGQVKRSEMGIIVRDMDTKHKYIFDGKVLTLLGGQQDALIIAGNAAGANVVQIPDVHSSAINQIPGFLAA